MASNSDAKDSAKDNRAPLPFEPKKKKGKGSKPSGSSATVTESTSSEEAQSKQDKRKRRPQAAKEKEADSTVSAKAQARVEEIRAANRKKAAAKQAQRKKEQISGPDSDGSIPKEVSRRMVRRMAVLSITPVAIGVGIFFLSYYLLSREIVTFAPVVVLLVTMGCFGLGVLGLTYGMLSASWDDEPGSLIGFDQFKLNFGRILDARRASKT